MTGRPPIVSVVLPLLNAAPVLDQQLQALAGQTYTGAWELVVADNGSTDASLDVVERWRERLPALRVVDASDRGGAAAARNLGAELARGDAIAFCDADDVVAPGWLAALSGALQHHDLVAGSHEHDALNPGGTANWHGRSFETGPPVAMDFRPFASGSNMAVSRAAFFQVGGFDEQFGRLGAAGEDVDLSWRLQGAGHRLHFEPDAVVFYRHRHELRGVWRQYLQYGLADVWLYERFRGHGMRPRPLGQILRGYRALVRRLPALRHEGPRGAWVRDAAYRWGRVQGSINGRVMFL
jgi:glycosyltransferase involved in cell wall biosynthesis